MHGPANPPSRPLSKTPVAPTRQHLSTPASIQQFDEDRAASYDDSIRQVTPGYDVLHEVLASTMDAALCPEVGGASTGALITAVGREEELRPSVRRWVLRPLRRSTSPSSEGPGGLGAVMNEEVVGPGPRLIREAQPPS